MIDRNPSQADKLHTTKLSDQVYELLRDQITAGTLKPGTRLNLAQTVRDFGISKTPLREALHRLELDQLVVTKPRSGTYVAVPSLEDIAEICDLRKAIEWQAIQLATPRMPFPLLEVLKEGIKEAERTATEGDYEPFFRSDANLHKAIFDHCGNRRLVRVKESIDTYVHWLRVLGATGTHRIGGSTHRHKQIVDAIMDRDVHEARDVMELHIEEVKIGTMEDLSAEGVMPSEEIARAVHRAG